MGEISTGVPAGSASRFARKRAAAKAAAVAKAKAEAPPSEPFRCSVASAPFRGSVHAKAEPKAKAKAAASAGQVFMFWV